LEEQQKVLGIDTIWFIIPGVFLLSLGLGFSIHRILRPKRPPVPETNAILRICAGATSYRAHFVGVCPGGWAFTPPLQRDNYVALKPGAPIIMEAVVPGGVAILRTCLIERTLNPATWVAMEPEFWHVENRREAPRKEQLGHLEAKLNGNSVAMLDMSETGAQVRAKAPHQKGEPVKLCVSGLEDEMAAWVVDCDRRGDRYYLRLQFEEPANLALIPA
jgi:hypothetical protein